MFLSELTKIINAGPPIDGTGAGLEGVYVNMENFSHLTAIIQSGVGNPSTVTVEKDADGSGAGTAIDFNYRACGTAYNATGGDTLGALTAVGGVGGVALGATDNNFLVIELDAAALGTAFPYVRVVASAATNIISMIYILSGARYQEPPTALTV